MSNSTKFVKEGPDDRGRIYIIEGTLKPGNTIAIKRFICQVEPQETQAETEEIVNLLLTKLNA